ncbi:MAG: TolC family protein [Acidobacteriota bacterium]|nr:TolC family protein [Acidobacteriota bacterium]
MNHRRQGFVFILAFILAGPPAKAQDPPAGLTLDQAVETALKAHPDILAAQAGIKAASARRLQAEARPDPRLSWGTAGIPWTLRSGSLETEYSLGLEQTLEYPGRRAARVEIGRVGEGIAALELDRTQLVLAASVRKAYFRVVRSDRAQALLASASGLLDSVIEAVQVRYAAGRAAYADVLRARVDKARLQNQAIEERRERHAAAAELNALLGRPAGEPLRLVSGLESPPLVRTAEEIKAAAPAEHPSLRIAELRAEQASAAERLVGLNRKPDLTAGLFVPSKSVSGWGFSLGLTLPLSAKRWSGERAEAAAAREAGSVLVDGFRRRIAAMIEAAFESARLADEQVRVFELQLLADLEDELKTELDLYALGKTEAYALLDLYRTAAEARLEHLRAVYNGAIARIDLEIAGEESF